MEYDPNSQQSVSSISFYSHGDREKLDLTIDYDDYDPVDVIFSGIHGGRHNAEN